MFIIYFGEVSPCLTHVSFTTFWTCQFVYSGSCKFFVIMGFGSQASFDSVIREICYLYIWVFKYFSNICCFLANIGKCSPFWGGISICEFLVFFWGGGFGILRVWTGKKLLYRILWMTYFPDYILPFCMCIGYYTVI